MSSSSPCAACKLLEHNCTQDCVFAPYFPADQPQRFAIVDSVFIVSNIANMLNAVSPEQRKHMVNSLVYAAEMRLIDPIYGYIGPISISDLQEELIQKQYLLEVQRRMLAAYIGPAAAAAAADAIAEAIARLAADAAVDNDAIEAAVRFATDASAAVSDSAANVPLGHNLFAPPPPFYQHPQQHPQQQQEQYNCQVSCGVQGDEAYNGATSSGVGNKDGDTARRRADGCE